MESGAEAKQGFLYSSKQRSHRDFEAFIREARSKQDPISLSLACLQFEGYEQEFYTKAITIQGHFAGSSTERAFHQPADDASIKLITVRQINFKY